MINIFDKMLDSNKYVAKNAKYVKIDFDKLEKFSKNININKNEHWLKGILFGINNFSIEEIVNFLLIYHAIGFSYWADIKWEINYESNTYDGSTGLICALAREIKINKSFLDFNYLSKLSFKEFKRILKGNVELPLMKERYRSLIDVSKVVCSNMKSNFYQYIKDINSDIEIFNIITKNFKSYEDTSKYNNKKIYYYKRAQLLVSDILHIKYEKLKEKVFYNNLIGCSDYKIPQILRELGITIYTEELSKLVDNLEIIKKGSKFEVEIRSTMLIVINYIKKKIIINIQL